MDSTSDQPQKPSRYGRRLDELSEDERIYYREFLPPGTAPDLEAFPFIPEGQDGAGQDPASRGPKRGHRWLWLPHLLTLVAVCLAVASFTPLATVFGGGDPDLNRNYAMLYVEIAFFLLVFAAMLYGVFMLSRFTDHDDEGDERLMRPTDYAERLLEQDVARARRKSAEDDYYDSSWITGKNM